MSIVSRPGNAKYRENYDRIFGKKVETAQGYGSCPDCFWFGDPEGCNVDRDSPQCNLNRKPRYQDD
jgi:hypothetical protein